MRYSPDDSPLVTGVAIERMAASDEPACGSESAIVPNHSPLRILCRYFSLSAAEPCVSSRSAAQRVRVKRPKIFDEKPLARIDIAAHSTEKGRPSSLICETPRSFAASTTRWVTSCDRTALRSPELAAGTNCGGLRSIVASAWDQSSTKFSQASKMPKCVSSKATFSSS